MPEPFKNLLNEAVIKGMAAHFKKNWPEFDEEAFVNQTISGLDKLELKERTDRITDAMQAYFPQDFEDAGAIILASLGVLLEDDLSLNVIDEEGISGWAVMPLTYFVGRFGMQHFELSMKLFKAMTKRASSEFGIRYFLLESPECALAVLNTWAADSNHHVRRLVSEGTRPRLPWGMRLPLFIKDPSPVVELLELLKDDKEEYVRRSVANNLNDIAKDHPDLVADIAEKWMLGASNARLKLIRHACRTLIKQGHSKTLRVLGYKPPEIAQINLELLNPVVEFGGALAFSLSLSSDSEEDQALMIDYVIHHKKANGKTTPKVFKWRDTSLPRKNSVTISKKHALKKITTRVYYPGEHQVEVMINGVSVGMAKFELLM
jgi:3-methyladenine DNA glycosylase AlkC